MSSIARALTQRGFGRRIDARSPVHLTRPFFNGPPNHYPPDMMRSSDFENSDGPGAATVFVIRHAERLDRADPSWSSKALRPQDTPLSETGKHQAKRLGKWLYGRLPTRAPLAIFCSPFIRCVQTADAIASELEGLQRSGLHTASATKICIEPGLMEDMTFMAHLRQHEPWFLNPADLVCASPRIDLAYKPLREVVFERGDEYPGGCVETTPGGTLARCRSIALELANHPLVRSKGTALLVTHGCPSTHMVKSLCPAPGGGPPLPDYAAIKAGHYNGPPLQYTATTALRRDFSTGLWDLAPGFKLFSNEHDPRLQDRRDRRQMKVTRYVFSRDLTERASWHEPNPMSISGGRAMDDFEVPSDPYLSGSVAAGDEVTVTHPSSGLPVTFILPTEYRKGDSIRVRCPSHALATSSETGTMDKMNQLMLEQEKKTDAAKSDEDVAVEKKSLVGNRDDFAWSSRSNSRREYFSRRGRMAA